MRSMKNRSDFTADGYKAVLSGEIQSKWTKKLQGDIGCCITISLLRFTFVAINAKIVEHIGNIMESLILISLLYTGGGRA